MRLKSIIIATLASAFCATAAFAGANDPKPQTTLTKTKKVKKTRKLCPNGYIWDIQSKSCTEIDHEM